MCASESLASPTSPLDAPEQTEMKKSTAAQLVSLLDAKTPLRQYSLVGSQLSWHEIFFQTVSWNDDQISTHLESCCTADHNSTESDLQTFRDTSFALWKIVWAKARTNRTACMKNVSLCSLAREMETFSHRSCHPIKTGSGAAGDSRDCGQHETRPHDLSQQRVESRRTEARLV